MADMLVKLYQLPAAEEAEAALNRQGIRIKRALAPDLRRIIAFTKTCGQESFADEVSVAFAQQPPGCFIATRDKEIIGFACLEVTARGFFGPMAVLPEERGKGVGKVLLLRALAAMREMGYVYAAIGWPAASAIPFYEKCAGAVMIEDDTHGVYGRMIAVDD